MSGQPPSILYIHSHDTGRYVQPYGQPVPTPNIQMLADQGVLFRHAFCASPTCSGSRASLLTGQYCHTNGMFGLAHRGWRLADYGQHLIHPLRAAGYHAVLIGETKELMIEAGWGAQRVAEEQLFDLLLDPHEVRDLSSEPEHAEALAALGERVELWMRETEDPLRHGPIEPPPGAIVNRQDALSPAEAPRGIDPIEQTGAMR